MSERRPYIKSGRLIYRSGRVIYLVRPEPVQQPSLAEQFLRMVLNPAQGVAAVLRANPPLLATGVVVLYAGTLAGLLEGAWRYGGTGWLSAGGPLLLQKVAMLLALWLGGGTLLHLSGRLLGGQGSLRGFLQVIGLAVCVLPLASPLEPLWPGAALLAAMIWLLPAGYQLHRQAHRLPAGKAVAAMTGPALLLLGWGLATAGLLFRLMPPR